MEFFPTWCQGWARNQTPSPPPKKPSRLRRGSTVPQTATQFRRFPTILVERATQTTLLHSLERFPLKQVVCATPFAEFSNFCIRLYCTCEEPDAPILELQAMAPEECFGRASRNVFYMLQGWVCDIPLSLMNIATTLMHCLLPVGSARGS